jgi:peptide/nickel transport system permease protein
MLSFIVRRTMLALLTVCTLSIIAFVVIQLPPGDYIDTYVTALLEGSGSPGGGTATGGVFSETVARSLRAQHGLDKPIHIQYAKWTWNMVQVDFGQSLEFQKPVIELVTERLMMTVILAGTTALFAWGISIPTAIYSAVRQHSIEDYMFTFLGFMGLAIPDFRLALWLMCIMFVYFPDVGIGGLFSNEYIEAPWSLARVKDLLSHLWIAAFVVGTAGTAALIRMMRANLLDDLNKPYVTTARAKGLPEWKLIHKVPGEAGAQPISQHPGLPAAYTNVGQRHRVRSTQPAHRGAAPAAGAGVRGPVRLCHDRAAAGHSACNRDAALRHLAWHPRSEDAAELGR